MKIRIKGNSIRFRLTMPEVERLSRGERIEETTAIGQAIFRYAVVPGPDETDLQATFEKNCISLHVPGKYAFGWADSAQVGYSREVPLGGGGTLFLLLEKDFVCLDETGEDQSENYPNPKAPKA